MSKAIELEIITSTDAPLKANIKQLYIPAFKGKAGILENHKPYIAVLTPGEMFYTDMVDKNHYFYIRDGFIEVNQDKVFIISDGVEKAEDLNRDDIEKMLAELDKKIKDATKITDTMTPGEIQNLPVLLENALKEKKEFETRLQVVKKRDTKL